MQKILLKIMSKVCDLSGKVAMVGNNVSNSNKKTKRRFEVNLQTKKFYIPEEDTWITLKVSTRVLKSIHKYGITKVLDRVVRKGYF